MVLTLLLAMCNSIRLESSENPHWLRRPADGNYHCNTDAAVSSDSSRAERCQDPPLFPAIYLRDVNVEQVFAEARANLACATIRKANRTMYLL